MAFTLTVRGFEDGGFIPKRYTCEGEDISPALEWSGAPQGTLSLALIVEDPDAPAGTWNHWLLWDIPVDAKSISEGFQPGAIGTSGQNDFGKLGYGGPCPPKGHGPHRYYFRLIALETARTGLSAGARRADVDRALARHIITEARFTGRYQRNK